MSEFLGSRKENPLSHYGCYRLGPYSLGQGVTLANTLRRTLLAELEGVAIIGVQFEDPSINEYSSLVGVRESVLEILFNLREIVFYNSFPNVSSQVFHLKIQGKKKVYAKDICCDSSDIKLTQNQQIQLVDPNQYIAELTSPEASLEFYVLIGKGEGYQLKTNYPSQINLKYFFENQDKLVQNDKLKQLLLEERGEDIKTWDDLQFQNTGGCFLPIHPCFSPIQKVSYRMEVNPNDMKLTDINKESGQEKQLFILFEIWTNGSMKSKDALLFATQRVISIFTSFHKDLLQIDYREIIDSIDSHELFIQKKKKSF